MLKNIIISHSTCFVDDLKIESLNKINYIYGPNGSGKTTLSNLMLKKDFDAPIMNWENNSKYTIKVYNRDYVRAAFSKSGSEKSIFLLGENVKETTEKINKLRAGIDSYDASILQKEKEIEGYKSALEMGRNNCIDSIWKKRGELPQDILDNMKYIKSNKSKTLEKLVTIHNELSSGNSESENCSVDNPPSQYRSLEDISNDIKNLRGESLPNYWVESPLIEYPGDLDYIKNILESPIANPANTDVGRFYAEYSDLSWIVKGLEILKDKQNDPSQCPFCSQDIASLMSSIYNAISQEYLDSIKSLKDEKSKVKYFLNYIQEYKIKYEKYITDLINNGEIINKIFLDLITTCNNIIDSLNSKIADSERIIRVDVVDFKNSLQNLNGLIIKSNENFTSITNNRKKKKQKLTELEDESWLVFYNSLKPFIENYLNNKKSIESSIKGPEKGLKNLKAKKEIKSKSIKDLYKSAQTSEYAVERINKLLRMMQFHSFSLEITKTMDGDEGYCIKRSNGIIAEINELSEGERTFITFLYFLYSLEGMPEEEENNDILAVIDDPISSLDSGILYAVSSLIRGIIKEVTEDGKEIKRVRQLILLTHNTKFLHQVAYNTFGSCNFYRIIKMSPQPNSIELLDHSGSSMPIKTSYQELWSQVSLATRNPESNMPWLPNVLRRILESYFTTLGNKNIADLGKYMSYEENVVYESLIAWAHSGSHTIMDDEPYMDGSYKNEVWLKTFEMVFEKNGHKSHYDMMLENSD